MLKDNIILDGKTILVTGAAGFIGSNLVKRLLNDFPASTVMGIDNMNDYYDVRLKEERLGMLASYPGFMSVTGNIADKGLIDSLFSKYRPQIVVNLAAQAGVRYSITNPDAYIQSNIIGFYNILEACRHSYDGGSEGVQHLVYASSSSVYGLNGKVPFSENDSIAHPVSLYAASKKSDELMAHAYSHLYGIPSTGLRFFTVYGPWGRPDMSPFLFTDAILNNRPIKVFNNGDMLRDFTYIDDIVEGVLKVIHHIPTSDKNWNPEQPSPASSSAPYRIYNIGNSHPVKLMDFIQAIEEAIGREAEKVYLPMQPGDVYQTYADVTELERDFGFAPNTPLEIGLQRFADWYAGYYLKK